MISFRSATAKDAYEFYGKAPSNSFTGIVAVDEGNIVGIGGLFRHKQHLIAFTDLKPEMRPHKKALVKGCRMMINIIKKAKRPVYAVADPTEPTAAYLLAKIGFIPTGLRNEMGETLVWGGK